MGKGKCLYLENVNREFKRKKINHSNKDDY